MRRSISAVAMVAVMAVAASAQSKPPTTTTLDPKAAAKLQAIQDAKDKAAAAAKGPKGDVPPSQRVAAPLAAEDRQLSPEQLQKHKNSPGAAYASYSATCEPPRIAPGQSGTLRLMMLLKQDAVMPPSGASNIELQPVQGPLAFGTPQLRPARPAQLAEAFRGKAAFDDFAVFDIPVTVGATATAGAHPVNLSLAYELYRGKTGGWIDRFLDRVEVEVLVGNTATAQPAVGATVGAARPDTASIAASPPLANAADGSSPESDHRAPVEAGADSWSLLWIAGGGAVIVASLLLLRRRG